MTADLTTLNTIPRDHWQRPLVIPVGGGKPVAYTRATTYVGVLDDMSALMKWHGRMVALGLAQRDDLLLAVAAHGDDKKKLGEICEDAKEAAQASAAATTGTALHALTERVDRGEPLGSVPAAYRADLQAYAEVVSRFGILDADIERFTVNDDLRIGGTPDRIVSYQGRRYIADVKTGQGQLTYGAGKIAMQLAVYAHSQGYDPDTARRVPLNVDQRRAIVIALPAGEGTASLHWADIAAGWKAVQLATQVRAWRATKGLLTPFETPDADLRHLIDQATDEATLRALWADNTERWTEDLTAAAKARMAALGAA